MTTPIRLQSALLHAASHLKGKFSPCGLCLILLVLLVCPVQGSYQYYYQSYFYIDPMLDPSKWTENGQHSTNGNFITHPATSGGSFISNLGVPDGTYDCEINSVLVLTASGGAYTHYLRASNNAWLKGSAFIGNFYAVDLSNIMIAGGGSSGSGTLNLYRSNGSVLTLLSSASVVCHNGMVWRSIKIGSRVLVYIDNLLVFNYDTNYNESGSPGIGGRQTVAGNYFYSVALGPADRIRPSVVDVSSLATSIAPNSVDLQWQGAADDADGIGVSGYKLYRNGTYVTELNSSTYTDATVSPSQTYQYQLYSIDYHRNTSITYAQFSVTTPAAGAVDPRRVGIRPTGSYWGTGTGQIDLLSGNLNYTVPLLRAQGRGGWGVPFALSYNSQLWREDNNYTWKLGQDTGYGFGWSLQAGSITPYWSDYATLHHYTFTDSSGAEYRLDVNSSNVWTSQEGIYLAYDATARRLYFPDGSFWVFESMASGTEEDSGTRYPTLMQDSNGNQVLVRYQAGMGVPWGNSSSRILEIEDVRAKNQGSSRWTYQFTYDNLQPLFHLSSLTNCIGTAEMYNFTYSGNQTLTPPWSSSQQFDPTSLLSSIMIPGLNVGHSFLYGSNGSGELTRINLPNGGYYGWDYASQTYASGRTQREVITQRVSPSNSGPVMEYALSHDPGDSGRMVHLKTTVDPPNGIGRKVWTFLSDSVPAWQMGLNSKYEQQTSSSDPTVLRREESTWIQDSAGNAYISSSLTTLDAGQSWQKQKKTEQTLDAYGNVTQTKLYEYDSLSTPARIFNSTYLTDSNYTSRYIRNRLLTASVSNGSGGGTVTLVTNTYDGGSLTSLTGLHEHDSVNYGTGFIYRGNATTQTSPGSTRNLSYDMTGTMISANDGYGHSVAQTSCKNNAVPSVITPNSQSNLSNSYDYADSLAVTSVTMPNNSTGTTTYDQYGRPSVTHSPYGADTTYSYTYNPTTVTATTNGKWQKTTVDGLGRTTRVETGDSNGTQSIVDSEYAACGCTPLGKVWRQSNPYAPGGTPVWTTYTYDALGRTIQIDLPQGGATAYEFKGETTKITDPAGIWKKYTTNAFGKLTLVTEPNPQGGEVTTSYSYDLLDHPLQAGMTRGSTTQLRTLSYNATTQRLSSMSHPETGTTQFFYNADGTLYYRQDAKSQKVYYTYDTFGRVTQISRYLSSGAEDTAQRVTFAYDDSPTNGLGRLSQANWKTGGNFQFAYNYAYTSAGLPTSKKLTVTKTNGSFTQSGQLEATYSYDTEGKLNSLTYPTEYLNDPAYPGQYRYLATTGLTYNYGYDSLGRPNAMSSAAHSRTGNQAVTWVDNVSYGAANEMLEIRYRLDAANGQTPVNYYNETRQYNSRLQLTQLSAVPTGGAATSLTINYVYPASGNNGMLYQASDNLAGEVTYQYDSLNRLISAATTSNSWGLSFAYDGFGNRMDQTVTKGTGIESHLTIDPATNRINSSGYSYDSNGNLTQMPGASGSMTLEYDVENRLTRYYYAAGGVDERYGYGPSNERVWKGIPNQDLQDEVFFYGVDGKLLGRYRPALSGACGLMMTPLGKNVYFAGRLIRSQDRAVVIDQLGSVRIGYSEAVGEQLAKFYPFGEEISPVTAQNRDKYGTYYRDSSSSLDYALNRYYSSGSLGRFLTPDPYLRSANPGNPQSWNRYAYVNNDPINKNDPAGLDDGDVPWGTIFKWDPTWFIFQTLFGGAGIGFPVHPRILPPDPPRDPKMETFGDPGDVPEADGKWNDITRKFDGKLFLRNPKCGAFINGLSPNGIDFVSLTNEIRSSNIVWAGTDGKVGRVGSIDIFRVNKTLNYRASMDGTNRVFYRNPAQILGSTNDNILAAAIHESIHNLTNYGDTILGYAGDSTQLTKDILMNCFGNQRSLPPTRNRSEIRNR